MKTPATQNTYLVIGVRQVSSLTSCFADGRTLIKGAPPVVETSIQTATAGRTLREQNKKG